MAWPKPPPHDPLDSEAPLEEQRFRFAQAAAERDRAGFLTRYVGAEGECPVLNLVLEASDTIVLSGPGLAAWVERLEERAERGLPLWD
jgi:hypothetical protein